MRSESPENKLNGKVLEFLNTNAIYNSLSESERNEVLSLLEEYANEKDDTRTIVNLFIKYYKNRTVSQETLEKIIHLFQSVGGFPSHYNYEMRRLILLNINPLGLLNSRDLVGLNSFPSSLILISHIYYTEQKFDLGMSEVIKEDTSFNSDEKILLILTGIRYSEKFNTLYTPILLEAPSSLVLRSVIKYCIFITEFIEEMSLPISEMLKLLQIICDIQETIPSSFFANSYSSKILYDASRVLRRKILSAIPNSEPETKYEYLMKDHTYKMYLAVNSDIEFWLEGEMEEMKSKTSGSKMKASEVQNQRGVDKVLPSSLNKTNWNSISEYAQYKERGEPISKRILDSRRDVSIYQSNKRAVDEKEDKVEADLKRIAVPKLNTMMRDSGIRERSIVISGKDSNRFTQGLRAFQRSIVYPYLDSLPKYTASGPIKESVDNYESEYSIRDDSTQEIESLGFLGWIIELEDDDYYERLKDAISKDPTKYYIYFKLCFFELEKQLLRIPELGPSNRKINWLFNELNQSSDVNNMTNMLDIINKIRSVVREEPVLEEAKTEDTIDPRYTRVEALLHEFNQHKREMIGTLDSYAITNSTFNYLANNRSYLRSIINWEIVRIEIEAKADQLPNQSGDDLKEVETNKRSNMLRNLGKVGAVIAIIGGTVFALGKPVLSHLIKPQVSLKGGIDDFGNSSNESFLTIQSSHLNSEVGFVLGGKTIPDGTPYYYLPYGIYDSSGNTKATDLHITRNRAPNVEVIKVLDLKKEVDNIQLEKGEELLFLYSPPEKYLLPPIGYEIKRLITNTTAEVRSDEFGAVYIDNAESFGDVVMTLKPLVSNDGNSTITTDNIDYNNKGIPQQTTALTQSQLEQIDYTQAVDMINAMRNNHGDQKLFQIYYDFASQMKDHRDHKVSTDEVINKFIEDFLKYVSVDRFYSLNLSLDTNPINPNMPYLSTVFMHPEKGYFCLTAHNVLREILESVGIRVDSLNGRILYKQDFDGKEGIFTNNVNHIQTVVIYDSGKIGIVDSTPQNSSKTSQEDLDALSFKFDKNKYELINFLNTVLVRSEEILIGSLIIAVAFFIISKARGLNTTQIIKKFKKLTDNRKLSRLKKRLINGLILAVTNSELMETGNEFESIFRTLIDSRSNMGLISYLLENEELNQFVLDSTDTNIIAERIWRDLVSTYYNHNTHSEIFSKDDEIKKELTEAAEQIKEGNSYNGTPPARFIEIVDLVCKIRYTEDSIVNISTKHSNEAVDNRSASQSVYNIIRNLEDVMTQTPLTLEIYEEILKESKINLTSIRANDLIVRGVLNRLQKEYGGSPKDLEYILYAKELIEEGLGSVDEV